MGVGRGSQRGPSPVGTHGACPRALYSAVCRGGGRGGRLRLTGKPEQAVSWDASFTPASEKIRNSSRTLLKLLPSPFPLPNSRYVGPSDNCLWVFQNVKPLCIMTIADASALGSDCGFRLGRAGTWHRRPFGPSPRSWQRSATSPPRSLKPSALHLRADSRND